ncbi:MAG: alanine racemase [Lachnospiraceae bacterium]|nr:alanine racemase [Lachnospiraceae bacterium]
MEFKDYQDLYDSGQLRTPAYIFDIDTLQRRVSYIKSRLPGIGICYAMKANAFLVSSAKDLVDSFEICSPGEERICRKAGIPACKMVLSGVNKEASDFEDIFRFVKEHADGGEPICTVESLTQMNMLEEQAGCVFGQNHSIEVLLRLTSGTQFGMEEDEIITLVRERASWPHLRILGIQVFSGTQKRLRTIKKEIAEADALIARIENECGYKVEMFEFGPGAPVSYFKKDTPVDDEELLRELYDSLMSMNFKGRISLEMGRYIAASCGSYITKIMDMKRNHGTNYLICDGGIHQVNYYGQMMAMKLPYMLAKGGEVPLPESAPAGRRTASRGTARDEAASGRELYDICGSLCTINDVLVKEVPLQHPEVDDILVFMNVGAYSVTEGISLFLSRDLPRVYRKCGDTLTLLRDKIQTEDFNYG